MAQQNTKPHDATITIGVNAMFPDACIDGVFTGLNEAMWQNSHLRHDRGNNYTEAERGKLRDCADHLCEAWGILSAIHTGKKITRGFKMAE